MRKNLLPIFNLLQIVITTICMSFAGVIMTPPTAHAADLIQASDTITTSRSSPSTVLTGSTIGGSNTNPLLVDTTNNSDFLPSDIATLWGGTSQTVTIATKSADNTKLYLTAAAGTTHAQGSAVSVGITAVHVVQFTVQTPLPTGSTIKISFPAWNSLASADSNPASPSATTFQGTTAATTSNVKIYSSLSTSTTCTTVAASSYSAGGTPTITCTTATAAIPVNSVVTLFLGCGSTPTGNTISGCATQSPFIINPTKTNGSGVADFSTVGWPINITTADGLGGGDAATARVATVESVNVIANVADYLTFTISGLGATASVCSDTMNSGYATTPTDVNLGTIPYTGSTVKAGQSLTITTNSGFGYSLTATSSGQLTDSTTAYSFANAQGTVTANDTPNPAAETVGTEAFGIHPCLSSGGATIAGTWGTGGGSSNKFANPSAAFYYTLASRSTRQTVADVINVEYGATASSTTPGGSYRTTLTYVVTPSF